LFSTLSCFLFFRHARSLAEFPCDATIAASFQRARLSAKIWAFYPALDDDDCTSCFLEFRTALKEMKGKKIADCSGEGQGKCKALFHSMGSFYGDGMFVVAGASLLKSTWGFPQDSLVKKIPFLCTGIKYFGIDKIPKLKGMFG